MSDTNAFRENRIEKLYNFNVSNLNEWVDDSLQKKERAGGKKNNDERWNENKTIVDYI